MEEDKLSFIASLPPIQSAIQVSGLGDGARVKLYVPQSEITAILRLSVIITWVLVQNDLDTTLKMGWGQYSIVLILSIIWYILT